MSEQPIVTYSRLNDDGSVMYETDENGHQLPTAAPQDKAPVTKRLVASLIAVTGVWGFAVAVLASHFLPWNFYIVWAVASGLAGYAVAYRVKRIPEGS